MFNLALLVLKSLIRSFMLEVLVDFLLLSVQRSPGLVLLSNYSSNSVMEQEAETSLAQADSSNGFNLSSSDAVSKVRKLLFRQMMEGIKNGRLFLGTVHCKDKQGNIILQDVVEYRSTRHSIPFPMEQRCLGLILIPSSC